MKWGRKTASPTSSRSSLITRVFPVSWFSKFKQKGGSSETSSGKKQQRGKLDFPTRNSSLPARWREARFYSVDDDDDDAYWRLSFREERAEGRRRTGRINPLWYDSDDEFQVSVSSFKSVGLRETELPMREIHRSINDIHKMKEKQYSGAFRRKKPNQGAQLTTLRKDAVKDRRSRKLSRSVVRKKKAELKTGPDDGEGKSSKAMERDKSPIEPENMDQTKEEFRDSASSNSRNQHNISFRNLSLSSGEEDYVFAALDGEGSDATSERLSISKCQTLENKKFKEIKVKTESRVKSAYISRRSHSRKIKQTRTKAYAPKSECRIRVLEDMKKARKKLKKETKEQAMEGRTTFNRFAVVKSSFNPQHDFRDSMVEMIREKGIRRPEELEELLACYLTLNCDEYHDLIIKVFQQVWFELSGGVY